MDELPGDPYRSTRKGEVFIDDPVFHKDDFEWEEIKERCERELRLKHGNVIMSPEQQLEFEEKAQEIWEKHYKHHRQNFFPIKNYIPKAFKQLDKTDETFTLVECGCGTGSSLFPIVKRNPHWKFHAFDFSSRAIDLLRSHEIFTSHGKINAFVWDISNEENPTTLLHKTGVVVDADSSNNNNETQSSSSSSASSSSSYPVEEIQDGSVDFALVVFMLSAVSPAKMPLVIERLKRLLRPGGLILFRDYGLYDLAQMRQPAGRMLEDNFFAKGDGTRCFYFSQEFCIDLFENKCGMIRKELAYHTNKMMNRFNKIQMHRVFIHAIYEKRQPCQQQQQQETTTSSAPKGE